ncbi:MULTISPECIES: response regulator transcription factor [Roseobacteraceae]|uniref:winged helix-turn-helix transcriptional regulator n=1 Tax=Roseobacteraceae TaxID=2854170 RepID=UPI00080ABCC5|nr:MULTISPECIES: response regulator transcription factor [Roseobacteraceae]ANT59894.1 transcriptional regulator [Salipiger sp. CCB-MM3]MCA0997941.1 response regulator transcription factor [Alloyangia pacifica]NDW01713.1 response regulator transcription factor [Salipiger sp. PrR002]NDW59201.1 response regulator transcription factor [Salipiger sp. PrR004]
MRYLIAETTWKMMSLSHALAQTGTLLTSCEAAEDIEEFHRIGAHDLLLIDAGVLRQQTTLTRLRELNPEVPIALIARGADGAQIATWLMGGADTVLAEDTPADEIIARLGAVARRAHGISVPVSDCGPLRIDLEKRRVHMGAAVLSLSPKLYEILEFLALRPGRLATREKLMSHVYGFENEPAPRVFDVYMCNLRAHLASLEGALTIDTVRGEGYRLRVTERRSDTRTIAA